jgi:hypothetical protein
MNLELYIGIRDSFGVAVFAMMLPHVHWLILNYWLTGALNAEPPRIPVRL